MSNKEDNWFNSSDVNKSDKKDIINKEINPTQDKSTPIAKKGFLAIASLGNFLFSKIIQGSTKVATVFRSKPLLLKILYTLLMLLIFRLASSITAPGVEVDDSFASDSSSFIGVMNVLGGGGLAKFSIMALGINPAITASIIMMLLQSEAFPPIHRLAKSGPAGKRKIAIITRVITVIFAILQAMTLVQEFSSGALNSSLTLQSEFDTKLFKFFVIPVILVSGSLFGLFLSEQITKKGVGNGTSLIIFSGIAINLPTMFKNAYEEIVGKAKIDSAFIGIMNFIIYSGVFLILIFISAYIYKSERHVPLQKTGSGMTMDSKQMSRLPIKLNPSGVMPIIFSLIIISLPQLISRFLDRQNEARQWIETNLKLTSWFGLVILAILLILFTLSMSFMTFNPDTVAEDFKKGGTFIPGLKPGNETRDYLAKIIIRLSIFSGLYLTGMTAIKYIMEIIGLSSAISFGGTTILILSSVAIETIAQLKARDQTNKISKAKIKTNNNSKDSVKGLLW